MMQSRDGQKRGSVYLSEMWRAAAVVLWAMVSSAQSLPGLAHESTSGGGRFRVAAAGGRRVCRREESH